MKMNLGFDNKTTMSHGFSLYLDIIRFIGAIAVFLGHLSSDPFTIDIFQPIFRPYADIAVTVFFVLSGFVIAFVTSTRETTAIRYFSARIARMYSVVIMALIITLLFDNIGSLFNPDFYSSQKIMWKPQSVEGYIASLFFVNEYQVFGFNGISPGSNAPFWSLSFEVTYYVIAGLFLFSRRWFAVIATIVILALAGKTIAAMLPLWVLGYCLYFAHLRSYNIRFPLALGLLSLAILMLTPQIISLIPQENFGMWFPVGRGPFNRNIIQDYLAAFSFSVHLVCMREILEIKRYEISRRVTGLIRWLGAFTFPLYAIHYPAISFIGSLSPWSNDSIKNVALLTGFTFVLVAILTPCCDKLKNRLQSAVSTGFSRSWDWLRSARKTQGETVL